MLKILILLLPIVVLAGCSQPEYTIVADSVWMEGWHGGEDGGGMVKALAKETGKKISIMQGEITGEREYMEEVLSMIRGETAVFSPLLSARVDPEMAEKAGKKVILSSFVPGKNGDFLTSILLSRREAYRKAGEACARMLTDEPDVYGTKAAAVFYTATPRRREEMEMFKAGFAGIQSAEALQIFEIAGIEDRRTVKPFLDEVKRSNIRLVLLSAARLNVFCLEECAKDDRSVLLEEGSGVAAFQENIRGSIEFNTIGLLRTAVSVPFESLPGTVVEAEFIQK